MTPYSRVVARLRGVCILAVLLSHYKYEFRVPFYGPLTLWTNGHLGVTAFFVVSGYLITSNMVARYGTLGAIRPRDFYVRRAARIIPPLLLLLGMLSALGGTGLKGLAIPPDQSLPEMLWYALTFRFNLYVQQVAGHVVVGWAILWSLSVEEVFYLVYPLLALLLKERRLFIAMLGCVVVAGPLARLSGGADEVQAFGYFACFDSIASGALIALIAPGYAGRFGRLAASAIMAAGASIAAAAYLAMPMVDYPVIGPELVSLGAAMILFGSRCGPVAQRSGRVWHPLAFLGNCSYELYLYHVVLFSLLRGALRTIEPAVSGALVFVVVLTVTILACTAIRTVYAEPMNRLLRRRLDAGDRPSGVVRERRAAL